MKEAKLTTFWGTGEDRSAYLTRITVGRLKAHVFWRGDVDPDCHDHPASFWTFPLTSYVEEVRRPDGSTFRRLVCAFRPHFRPAEYAHRVLGAWSGHGLGWEARPIITLTLWLDDRRAWGFWITGAGWVPFMDYAAARDARIKAMKDPG